MKLVNPTDVHLDTVFAEKVAGWMQCERLGKMVWYDPAGGHEMQPPRFTDSIDLVLPLLEKEIMWTTQGVRNKQYFTSVTIDGPAPRPSFEGRDNSFAKSAVIALLLAHGVEIEFT